MNYELIGKCTVYVLGSVGVIMLIIILFFIGLLTYGKIEDYQYQKKAWNNGISPNSNTPWKFLRRYHKTCTYEDDKGYELSINFRSVDKYKVKDEKQ